MCCGQPMEGLVPNTVEASVEKHLPVVTVSKNNVNVKIGSVEHPMTEEHHMTFIYLETEHGGQRKHLKIGETPAVNFSCIEDKPIAVYAYCNLHGLWKTVIA